MMSPGDVGRQFSMDLSCFLWAETWLPLISCYLFNDLYMMNSLSCKIYLVFFSWTKADVFTLHCNNISLWGKVEAGLLPHFKRFRFSVLCVPLSCTSHCMCKYHLALFCHPMRMRAQRTLASVDTLVSTIAMSNKVLCLSSGILCLWYHSWN